MMAFRKLNRPIAGVVLGGLLLALAVFRILPLLADDESSPVEKAAADTVAPTEAAVDASEQYRIQWKNQPLDELLRSFASTRGLKLEMGDVSLGTISHELDDQLYTPAGELDLLRGHLLEKNFLLAQRGKTLVVADLRIPKDVDASLNQVIQLSKLPQRGKNELTIVAFPPSLTANDESAATIKRMLSRHGKIRGQTYKGETLVLDRGENLRHIHEALLALTANSAKDDTKTQPNKNFLWDDATGKEQQPAANGASGASWTGLFGAAGGAHPRYMSSGKIAVSWSKAGDALWGYSSIRGRWAKVKIDPPKKGVAPTMGVSVLAVSTGDRIYAFSNQTGRWAALKAKGMPTVSHDDVIVEEGGDYHIFSDATGRWASQSEAVEEAEGESDELSKAKLGVKDPKFSAWWGSKGAKGATGAAVPAAGAVGVAGGGFGGGGGIAGGGGFGGGGFPPGMLGGTTPTLLPPSAIPSKQFVEGLGVIVAWSEANDMLWGYSESLGSWTRHPVSPTSRRLIPTLGDSVAFVQGDDRLYAYSAVTGKWAELKTTAQAEMRGRGRIVVEDKDKTYVFSAAKGRWTSPNDSLDPSKTDETLRDNFRTSVGSGLKITIPSEPMTEGSAGFANGDAELLLQGFSAKGVVEDLRKAYDQTDREITQAVAEYRKLADREGPNYPDLPKLKSLIEGLVEKGFTYRQQAQATEAEILRHRLKQVDARLAERERLKTKITQRHVQSLLDPALNWEPPTGDTPPRR
jgi:hypothetical protein